MNKKNYQQALTDKLKMRDQKVRAEREARQTELCNDRLMVKDHSLQEFRKKLNNMAGERDRLRAENKQLQAKSAEHVKLRSDLLEMTSDRDNIQEKNVRLQSNCDKVLKLESQLREMQGELLEVQGYVNRMECERGRLRKQNQQMMADLTALQRKLKDVSSGTSVVEVSRVLGVSPQSMQMVERYSTLKGNLASRVCQDASSPDDGDRKYYLERIGRVLTPAVERICSIPKFGCDTNTPGVTDVSGVAKLIARRIERNKGKARRKLFQVKRRLGGSLNPDLDTLLKELATAWRSACRNQERDAAARLLQMTVLAIPKRHGKCQFTCIHGCIDIVVMFN